MTSKWTQGSGSTLLGLTASLSPLATVGIVSLLTVALFPVGDLKYRRFSGSD